MYKCIVCNGDFYAEPLMQIENLPKAAQNIPNEKQILQDKPITLNLCQCKNCGLVQLDCKPVSYYKDVIRAGGFSTTMVNIRKKQYEKLINTYNLKNKKIIEVGCGRGEFLEILNEFNVKAYGIEHSKKLVEIAKEKGLNVENNFAKDKYTNIEHGPFDAFLSFNFLEHQPNPNGMLQAIYSNLKDGGVGLVTVPSFEYILEQDGFYEIIRDHIAYYTMDTIKFLFNKNGFEILESEIINRDTISIIVAKREKMDISNLKNNYATLKKEINQYIDSLKSENKKVAVWGAGHQGFTILSTTNIASKIEYVIDSAPFKQGKYTPASHVKIVSPEYCKNNMVDAIIVVAPGYSEEIIKIIRNKIGREIQIATLKSKHLDIIKEEI